MVIYPVSLAEAVLWAGLIFAVVVAISSLFDEQHARDFAVAMLAVANFAVANFAVAMLAVVNFAVANSAIAKLAGVEKLAAVAI